MQTNIPQITNLVDQIASSMGLELLDAKMGMQGKSKALIVTIYKPGCAVSLEDCEKLSRQIEQRLDGVSPPLIDGSYVLEVESPGTDRKLTSQREFDVFQGSHVEVKTKQKVDGLGSAFTGTLAGFSGTSVLIAKPKKMSDKPAHKRKKTDAKDEQASATVEVEMTNVIHVRLAPLENGKGNLDRESGNCAVI